MRDLRQAESLVRTMSASELKQLLEAAGAVAQLEDPHTLIVRGLSIEEIGASAFRAGIVLHELSPHAGSLEDLFLEWTGSARGQEEVEHL